MSDDISNTTDPGLEPPIVKEERFNLFLASLYTALGSLEMATYAAHLYGADINVKSRLQDIVSGLRSFMSEKIGYTEQKEEEKEK